MTRSAKATGVCRAGAHALVGAWCVGALACGDPTTDDPSPILLTDAHNYQATAQLSIPRVETESGADLDICWTDVTQDLLCHGVEPGSDIDNVALLRLRDLTEPEVEAKLAAGALAQAAIDGYLEHPTDEGETCTRLSSMTLFGTQVVVEEEVVEQEDRRYLLLVTTGTTPGVGVKSMAFLRPRSSSSSTSVAVSTGCGLLDFTAALASATPLFLPERGPWVVDWGSLTRDGLGNTNTLGRIDRLMLAFYAEMSVADLEKQPMDLEQLSTFRWELELEGGHRADLTMARTAEGRPFAGFDRDAVGAWLLGLTCQTCQNPAPVVLSVIEPTWGNQ